MTKKEIKQKAKENSFVAKLTKKNILELLKILGYVLNENCESYTGKPIPAIERCYDDEKNEFAIDIRCKKDDIGINLPTQTNKSLWGLYPFMQKFEYSLHNRYLHIKDFSLSTLCLIDENEMQENQNKYARFMYRLFGEDYRKKYNAFVKQKRKEEKVKE